MRKFFSLRVFLLLVLSLLFVGRFLLVVTRYFDPDEFAHLHWSFLLYKGYVPYRDFFINFSPVYFWLFAILYVLPHGSYLVIVARLLQYGVYLAVAATVYIIARNRKHREAGLFATIIFLTFPVTFDKTLEIRHDTLMTLLFFAAFAIVVITKKFTRLQSLIVGLLTALSVLVLTKIVVFLPSLWVYIFLRFGKRKILFWYLLGFVIPIVIFTVYLVAYQTVYLSWENIVHGSQVLKAGEGTFSVLKTLSPYQFVYVATAGVSLPWILSTSLWSIALVTLVWLFWKQKRFAIAGSLFFVGTLLSLLFFPTPYTQYFIPPSVFASILASIGICSFAERVSRNFMPFTMLFLAAFCGFLFVSFGMQASERFSPGVSMDEQKTVLDDVLRISKPDETFYDMVGSYVFRPHGYYICCNIYSAFSAFLHIPLPSLSQSLITQETKYIVLDRAGKSLWLPYPQDLAFLLSNYLPSRYPKIYTAGIQFSCSTALCTQLDLSNKALSPSSILSILYKDNYTIEVIPNTESVTIGQNVYVHGQVAEFEKGKYEFRAPNEVSYLKIQLAR